MAAKAEKGKGVKPVKIDVGATHRNPVFVSVSEYRGTVRLDVRHFYFDASGQLMPTRDGISIPVEDAPKLMQALSVALREAGLYSLVG